MFCELVIHYWSPALARLTYEMVPALLSVHPEQLPLESCRIEKKGPKESKFATIQSFSQEFSPK